MSLYRRLIRPGLFRFDPERMHHATLTAVRLAGRLAPARHALRSLFVFDDPRLRVSVGELSFPNPVGLAGGFDKNGVAVEGLACAGFGFIEVGSVSAYPSDGNPERPRLFRLPLDEAIVVYYGVPNQGAEAVARRLSGARLPVPLGINLVETNTGKQAEAGHVIEELTLAVRPFLGLADYVTLNLNCPNTSGGRSVFDDPACLKDLLEGYAEYGRMPSTFVKVVPTTDPATIDRTLAAIDPFPFVRGVIFGLPSGKPYAGLRTPAGALDRMPGTLCGRPVRTLVDASLRAWYPRMDHTRHILVGVGGIFSAEDAYEKIRLGATLVQLYTALIYHGPGLVKRINRGLCRLLERDGFRRITEAVGVDNRELVYR
jgi:dihydroorotate dehydrogenase (fumarate)/dihydroorotate dehydrogenase